MRSGVIRCPPHLDTKIFEAECQFYGIGTKEQNKTTNLNPKEGFSDKDLTEHLHEVRDTKDRMRVEYMEQTKQDFFLRNEKILVDMKESIFSMLADNATSYYHYNRFLVFILPPISLPQENITPPPSSYITDLADYKTLPDSSQTTYNQQMVELLDNAPCVEVLAEKMKKEHSLTLYHEIFHLELVSVVTLRGTEKWVKGGKKYGRVMARITGHAFGWIPTKAYIKKSN